MGGVLPNSNRLNRQHMAPTGKPCLVLHGYAQAQTINPHIIEHRVAARLEQGEKSVTNPEDGKIKP
jgi:hypothetical protein